MDTAGTWDALASQGPMVAFCMGLLWMLITGKLVTSREHQAMVRDRNLWRDIAAPAVRAAERATIIAERQSRETSDVG